ncbi:MAG: hypothetical protein Q9168_000298 [Polycauliona sp. 1 TL-2023]
MTAGVEPSKAYLTSAMQTLEDIQRRKRSVVCDVNIWANTGQIEALQDVVVVAGPVSRERTAYETNIDPRLLVGSTTTTAVIDKAGENHVEVVDDSVEHHEDEELTAPGKTSGDVLMGLGTLDDLVEEIDEAIEDWRGRAKDAFPLPIADFVDYLATINVVKSYNTPEKDLPLFYGLRKYSRQAKVLRGFFNTYPRGEQSLPLNPSLAVSIAIVYTYTPPPLFLPPTTSLLSTRHLSSSHLTAAPPVSVV